MTASRYRARASRPSAPLWWLRDILFVAQPPLLCEEGNALGVKSCQKNNKAQTCYTKNTKIFLSFVPLCG